MKTAREFVHEYIDTGDAQCLDDECQPSCIDVQEKVKARDRENTINAYRTAQAVIRMHGQFAHRKIGELAEKKERKNGTPVGDK